MVGEEDYTSAETSLEDDSYDSFDQDSALGDNVSVLSMSITSSVYDYRFENGRRYHAYQEGKYLGPNDEAEKDRLDLQHHTFRLCADGALYIAPIPTNVHNVLDVGCGTGIWAIEFAEEHPSATVLGTDLSFLVDDADQDWIFRENFDFIHARAMMIAFKDWSRFFGQAYRHLTPGGYLELQEFYLPPQCLSNPDLDTAPSPSPIIQWGENMVKAGAKIGIDMRAATAFAEPLRAAGFVDIHVKYFKWPYGEWAKGDKFKVLGRFALQDLRDGLASSVLALFTRVLGWSREEVEIFLASVRKEIKEMKECYWQPVVFWYARKPEDPSKDHGDQKIVMEEITLEVDEDWAKNIHSPEPKAASTTEPETAEEAKVETLAEAISGDKAAPVSGETVDAEPKPASEQSKADSAVEKSIEIKGTTS